MTKPPSKPPAKADQAQPPLRVTTHFEEVEDTHAAAELLRRILRAQAAELEGREQTDDAA